RVLLGVLLFGFALGSTPRALAEDVAGVLQLRQVAVLTTPRDPDDFMNDLDVVLPRPMVVLTREDAVARELLKYSRTMSERDALRTAHALCEEGRKLGWDPLLFVAVIHIESYYDHLAVSPVGAEGLMQLMPPTAEWVASLTDLSWPDSHSFDPVLNVRLGTNYLAHLNTQFRKLDHILTAYNRGPRATRYILGTHGELPDEIRDFYATKVLERYHLLRMAYGHLPIS
ncbi:MAG: lytic transglycosylase domain-containing protein, partial [Myxococcota bacterium]